MSTHQKVRQQVFDRADQQIDSLRSGLETSFESTDAFQEWIADRLDLLGASTNEFTLSPADLKEQPAFSEQLETDPDAIRFGTNLISCFPSEAEATTLLYAHADKAPSSYQYATADGSLDFDGERLVGPGIADDVSDITAAIGAVEAIIKGGWKSGTGVMIASVFGKQLGVGGTYGLMRRYDPADAAVYIHPAESGRGLNDLKVGSNGIYECTIELQGRQPSTSETHHPLYVGQGTNPLEYADPVIEHLQTWVNELADEYAHDGVERVADTSAGLLVSDIQTDDDDRPVYESPQNCTITAVLAFPPGASLETIEEGVHITVNEAVSGTDLTGVAIRRGDHIADSAEAETESQVVRVATDSVEGVTGHSPEFYYGHTASDIRYPMRYWEAPTVGFGPKAGAMGDPAEWIDRKEYLETVSAIAAFLINFEPVN